MKYSFSTLGSPVWDFETAVQRAKEYGYDAIDIRALENTTDVIGLDCFSADLKRSTSVLRDAGIEISCFSASAKCYSRGAVAASYVDEIKGYLDLCGAFGAPAIRVFGGDIGDATREAAYSVVVDNCRKYVELAAPYKVSILFETHDAWTDSNHVQEIMTTVNSEYLGVVWDVAHPYRHSSESAETTWELLHPWIKNTHWKDSYPAEPTEDVPRNFRLCLMGEGQLPLSEFADVLRKNDYSGYYTLEWEKMWHPYLPEPEEAFPQFIKYMRNLEAKV